MNEQNCDNCLFFWGGICNVKGSRLTPDEKNKACSDWCKRTHADCNFIAPKFNHLYRGDEANTKEDTIATEGFCQRIDPPERIPNINATACDNWQPKP